MMRWLPPKRNPEIKTDEVKWPTVDYSEEMAASIAKGRKKKKKKTDADGDYDDSTSKDD